MTSPCHENGRRLGGKGCYCMQRCCNESGRCICPDEDRTVCDCRHPEETPVTFEPGDKVRHKDNHNRTGLEVLAVRGDRFWGLPPSGNGPLTYRTEEYEKIEPFFEAGKTYERAWDGAAFKVKDVEEDSGGKAAFGLMSGGPLLNPTWVAKRIWNGWREAGDIPFEG